MRLYHYLNGVDHFQHHIHFDPRMLEHLVDFKMATVFVSLGLLAANAEELYPTVNSVTAVAEANNFS